MARTIFIPLCINMLVGTCVMIAGDATPPRPGKISRQASMESVHSAWITPVATPLRAGLQTGITPNMTTMHITNSSLQSGSVSQIVPAHPSDKSPGQLLRAYQKGTSCLQGVSASPERPPFWQLSPGNRLPYRLPSAPSSPIFCSAENAGVVKEAQDAIDRADAVGVADALSRMQKSPNRSAEKLAARGVKRILVGMTKSEIDVSSPEGLTKARLAFEDTVSPKIEELQRKIDRTTECSAKVQADKNIPYATKLLRAQTYAANIQAFKDEQDTLRKEIDKKNAIPAIIAHASLQVQQVMHFPDVEHVFQGHIGVTGQHLWEHAYTGICVKHITSGPVAGAKKSVYPDTVTKSNFPRYLRRIHAGIHFDNGHKKLYAESLQNGYVRLHSLVRQPDDHSLTYRTVFPLFSCIDLNSADTASSFYLGSLVDPTTRKKTEISLPADQMHSILHQARTSGSESYISECKTKRLTRITDQVFASCKDLQPYRVKNSFNEDVAAFWVLEDVATSGGAAGSATP